MDDAVMARDSWFRAWLADRRERVLSAVAVRLPRSLVYYAALRLWLEVSDELPGGREGLESGALTCAHALDRWNVAE
jgi:hypothetical protein